MSWAYRCSQTGLVDFCDGPGLQTCSCGQEHEAYEVGAGDTGGPVNIVGDKLPKHFDWGVCEWIDSRARRKSLYKAKGLRFQSRGEYRANHGGLESWGRKAFSYAGQKDRRSSDEKFRHTRRDVADQPS